MVNGRLNLELLKSSDRLFAEAAESGMTWKVIGAKAVQEFPEIPALLQAAANCSGHLAKPEHEMQLMRRLKNTLDKAILSGQSTTWNEMKASILRSKPSCGNCAPYMHRYLLKFAEDQLFERTERLIKGQSSSGHQLGPEFFEALSMEPKPVGSDPVIFFRHALLVTAYGSLPKLIQASDVRRALGKEMRSQVQAANTLILECYDLIGMAMFDFQIQQDYAKLQMDVVLAVLGKKHKEVVVPKTAEHAALKFVDQYETHHGVRITQKWDNLRQTGTVFSQPGAESLDKRLCICKESRIL